MRRALVVCGSLLASICVWTGAPALAQTTSLIPPVAAPIARHFEPPVSEYGRGHRGVDLRAPAGEPVRAAGAGTVTFAGSVGDTIAVSIAHGHGLETTYSSLSEVSVSEGQRVEAGTWLGRTGLMHPGGEQGLHFGVKLHGRYVDPLAYIGPVDEGSAFSLVPVVPDGVVETLRGYGIHDLTTLDAGCASRSGLEASTRPPNENVVVAIAGIGSHTQGGVSAEIHESGATALGYPEAKTYRFSYAGSEGPDLHERYGRADTFGDIEMAADRLRTLMKKIAEKHPGSKVDFITHSQGGIVARSYLNALAADPDPTLPRVEHLVTYSSPHAGAPLAEVPAAMKSGLVGKALLGAMSTWAMRGGPVPDPLAKAVEQLAPGSALLNALEGSSLPFGTRALTIAIPNDVIVPADRAGFDDAAATIVSPSGVDGHDAVVASSAARSAAFSFLGGASEICSGGWDRWGAAIGKAISFLERLAPVAIQAIPGF